MPILELIKNLTGRKILVYADFIDPFCYIGFHTLRALAEARGIELDWRGFELNPDTPMEGLPLMTAANSDLRPGMRASVEELARKAGLSFPEPRWFPNSRRAHVLVKLVQKPAKKNLLIEKIYQAYFMGQKDIAQSEVLIELAGAFEIPSETLRSALSDVRLTSSLETRRTEALRRGFLGLPGFVYKGKNYFGALSKEAWEDILMGSNR